MRNSMIAAAAFLTLTALPASAQNSGDAYVARGTEPFWSLIIDAGTMRFEVPGRAPVTVATPKVIHGFAGEIWQTPRINVNTNHIRCSDGMSDKDYRDTVTVTVDGRSYKGCGGDTALPAPGPISAVEGDWRITAIGGRAVLRGSAPTVTFRTGRISGNGGCNRFSGDFTFWQARLVTGPLASTRMACADRAAGAQEMRILRLFAQKLRVVPSRSATLVLRGARGESLTLIRSGRR